MRMTASLHVMRCRLSNVLSQSVALLENLLGEHGEVDTPVAPDVTAVGLDVLVLVTLGIPVVAQVDGALIEEVGVAHAHPVELGFAAEEFCTLLCEVGVGFDLLSEGLLHVEVLAEMQTCGEESVVVERSGVKQTDGEGVATTH